MSIKDLFRKRKETPNPQSDKKAEDDAPMEVSPYDFDSAIFAKFNDDLHRNALPDVPEPTDDEIMEYKLKRQIQSARDNPFGGPADETKLQSNMAIPVEVEIWVDKVSAYYFDDLRPMMGLVHWCNSATKKLYKYKGYDWYSISEIYPFVMFD